PTVPSHLPVLLLTEPAPPELYTLSLHDALPIWARFCRRRVSWCRAQQRSPHSPRTSMERRSSISRTRQPSSRILRASASSSVLADRKSTRLNSSHVKISYAVFCLKKKKSTRRRI